MTALRDKNWVWLAALAWLAACEDHSYPPGAQFQALEPVALAEDLVFIDPLSERALLLDVAAEEPEPRWRPVSLPSRPLFAQRRQAPEGKLHDHELLVLCAGEAETHEREGRPPALVVVEADKDASRRYELASVFDTLRQSHDGRYAFLFLKDLQGSSSLLANPNQAAIVDLSRPAGTGNPLARSLHALGSAPIDAIFSPHAVRVAGRDRRLVVLLAEGYVSILDLSQPDRQKTVPLVLPDAGRSVTPVQVLFEEDRPRIYVRSADSDQINVLDLNPQSEGGDDFVVSVTQVTAGRRPSDMLLYTAEDGASRLLVVASGSREITVIDPRSGQTTHIAVDVTVARAARFTAAAPGNATEAERVLLYAQGQHARDVVFVDLAYLTQRRRRNVEVYRASQGITRLVMLEERGLALLVHDTGGDTSAPQLSLLELAERTLSPILASVSLQDAMFDEQAERLWVGRVGSTSLGYMDLTDFQPGQVLLDAPVSGVYPMATTTGRVVVTHPGAEGLVTLLDAESPSRSTARMLRGFAFADILDRGEP